MKYLTAKFKSKHIRLDFYAKIYNKIFMQYRKRRLENTV